jgi:hypothetical protein
MRPVGLLTLETFIELTLNRNRRFQSVNDLALSPTGSKVMPFDRIQWRHLATGIHPEGAARGKCTFGAKLGEVGRLTGNGLQPSDPRARKGI